MTDIVRRWLLELKLAERRQKDWVGQAKKIYARYRSEKAKKNSFNILWANTEVLRPAIYNSIPKPDVRRRFKDADPIGKGVSEMLSRAIEYSLDTYDFDAILKLTALDMLLVGRGLDRVRYLPTIATVENGTETPDETLEYEQVMCDHVQWDDFRHGPGKTWDKVPWVAYRHRLTRKEAVDKFGKELGSKLKLDTPADPEINNMSDAATAELFKTAEVWEIWDKDAKEVVFVAESVLDQPLKKVPDPLGLQGFFPSPKPVYAIEDTSSLIPLPLYEQYREQAEELDRVSTRINKVVDAIRVRGIYDATLHELATIMDATDNDLIPAENVTALLERGGLEKAIWFLPIQQLAAVLKELYIQREATKQVIYELTGISDIVRGSTDPRETKGAQEIKAQWGTQRLQRMQREFQRYARDLIRIKTEIIAEKFQPETLAQMTSIKFPSLQEKQQAQMQLQQGQMEIQRGLRQPGPPPPELQEVLSKPAFEEVIQLMRSDALRSFRIDIETDSTIAASMEGEMSGLTEVLTGIMQFADGVMPAIQSGMFPVEAAKEIIMTICRRSRMGNAVEDALEKIQAPQGDPAAKAEEAKVQAEQQKQEADMQAAQMKAQFEQQLEQQRMQAEQQREQARLQMEERLAMLEMQQEARLEQLRAQAQAQTDLLIARIDAMTKVQVAEINAEHQEKNEKAMDSD